MSLKWVDCDLPAPEERSPEQIRKDPPFASLVPSTGFLMNHPPPPSHEFPVFHDQGGDLASDGVDGIDIPFELQRGDRGQEVSAAIDIHEDEQFNASTLEWSCVLRANVRQAGEFFPFNGTVSE